MSLPRLFRKTQAFQSGVLGHLAGEWFKTPLGRAILAAESDLCNQILPGMFGYHMALLGYGAANSLVASSPIRHHIELRERGAAITTGMLTRFDDLALANDSIDVLVLHHALDFSADPHGVLREASRVVIPGGKIIVIGFNPLSLWGLARVGLRHAPAMPWCGNFLGALRVSDWLSVLDFAVDGIETTWFGMPSVSVRANKMNLWLSRIATGLPGNFGAVYVMVAEKRVSRLTMIGPPKRRVTPLLTPVPMKTGTARMQPGDTKSVPETPMINEYRE